MAQRMNLGNCLDGMVKAGRITREQAAETIRMAERFERENARTMGLDAARAAAESQTAQWFTARARKNLDNTAKQIVATDRVLTEMAGHEHGLYRGAAALYARDITRSAGYSSLEGQEVAILKLMHGLFADGMETLRPKNMGLTVERLATQRFVREFYGEVTGDGAASAAARAWRETRQRFFWGAGSATSQRGPSLGAALGARR